MQTEFFQLNEGWNAEPNAPDPKIRVEGDDLLLSFYVNPYLYTDFEEGETATLRFVRCLSYRLGSTNDEGWYRGKCRFSKLAPHWGEFYLVNGDSTLLDAPQDWKSVCTHCDAAKHFLFYFRDETFECVAESCEIETINDNSPQRTGRKLFFPPLR